MSAKSRVQPSTKSLLFWTYFQKMGLFLSEWACFLRSKIKANKSRYIALLHYLLSIDLSKSFSQLIMSVFIFSRYVFQCVLSREKIVMPIFIFPQCDFQQILPVGKMLRFTTLLILWFSNFNVNLTKTRFSKIILRVYAQIYVNIINISAYCMV